MWSIGCVFGELLSMQQESVRTCEERLPLFPGSSCPSLSGTAASSLGDSEFDRQDQLSTILAVIGSPSEDDIGSLSNELARSYLRSKPFLMPQVSPYLVALIISSDVVL